MDSFAIKVTMTVKDYVQVDGEYKSVEARHKVVVPTYDDLQNLVLTLVEASDKTIRLEIEKEGE